MKKIIHSLWNDRFLRFAIPSYNTKTHPFARMAFYLPRNCMGILLCKIFYQYTIIHFQKNGSESSKRQKNNLGKLCRHQKASIIYIHTHYLTFALVHKLPFKILNLKAFMVLLLTSHHIADTSSRLAVEGS